MSSSNFHFQSGVGPSSSSNAFSSAGSSEKEGKGSFSPKSLSQLDKTVTSLKEMLNSDVIDIEKAQETLAITEKLTPRQTRSLLNARLTYNLGGLRNDYKIEMKIIKKLAAKGIHNGKVNLYNTKEFGVDISLQELASICSKRLTKSIARLGNHATKQKVLEEIEVTLKFQDFDASEKRVFCTEVLKVIALENITILPELARHLDLNDENKLDLIRTICTQPTHLTVLFRDNIITEFGLTKDSMVLISKEIMNDKKKVSFVPALAFFNALVFKVGTNEAYKICLENAPGKFLKCLEIHQVHALLETDPEFYRTFTDNTLQHNPTFLLHHLQYFLLSDPSLRESLLTLLARKLPGPLIHKLIDLKINDSSTHKALHICAERAPYITAMNVEQLNLDENMLDSLVNPLAVAMLANRPMDVVGYLQDFGLVSSQKLRPLIVDAMIMNAPEIFVRNIAAFGFSEDFRIEIAKKAALAVPEVLEEDLSDFEINDDDIIFSLLETISEAKSSNQRTPSPPQSSASSSASVPIEESFNTIVNSLSEAYDDLFWPFIADCCDKYATPKVLDLIKDFKDSGQQKMRFSKKEPPHLPFGLALRKKKNSDIVLQIYAYKDAHIGKGTYSSVKKSSKVQIDITNQSTMTPGVVGRTQKNEDYTYTLEGVKNHRLVLKGIKQKYPGKLIHIVPKINYHEHSSPYENKNPRLETFNTRYWGSIAIFENHNSKDERPIQGARATLNALSEIAEAVGMMTELGYIHGDVKTDNILLDQQGRAFLHDFDFTQQIGLKGGKSAYWVWDHSAEQGFMTPNADVYGLVMSAVKLLVPGFNTILRYDNNNKSALHNKMQTSLIETFEGCVFASTNLNMRHALIDLKGLDLKGKEWEKTLEDNFPIPFGVMKIFKREMENSLKLYQKLSSLEKQPKNIEEWQQIAKELNLTSPEQLRAEFLELCRRDEELLR